MHVLKTMRFALAMLAVAIVCAGGTTAARAQGGAGGGFQMPPEMKAKMEAWQKWREAHKNLTSLGDMVYQIGELDKDPAYQLDKKQATKALTVINPWLKKTSMSEDEAKSVSKQLAAVLNDKQIKKMATIETPSQRMQKRGFGGGGAGRGPGGAGGGAGRGPGGPGGGMPKIPDPPKVGWNPFNPDTLPFEQARPRAKKNLDTFLADLQKHAKG